MTDPAVEVVAIAMRRSLHEQTGAAARGVEMFPPGWLNPSVKATAEAILAALRVKDQWLTAERDGLAQALSEEVAENIGLRGQLADAEAVTGAAYLNLVNRGRCLDPGCTVEETVVGVVAALDEVALQHFRSEHLTAPTQQQSGQAAYERALREATKADS